MFDGWKWLIKMLQQETPFLILRLQLPESCFVFYCSTFLYPLKLSLQTREVFVLSECEKISRLSSNLIMTLPSQNAETLRRLPQQARSRERVNLILDAAAQIFEEVGYEAASTELIALACSRQAATAANCCRN